MIISENQADELGIRALVIAQHQRPSHLRESFGSGKMVKVRCPYHTDCWATVHEERQKPHSWRCEMGGIGVLDSLLWGIHKQAVRAGL